MPAGSEFGERLGAVLHVLYLIFNEGYASTSGTTPYRTDLSSEAIRLCRDVHTLLPNHPEVGGLLALMLLTDARRAARAGAHGELIPMAETPPEELPTGVIALVGWANRLVVISAWVWVSTVAWHVIQLRSSARDASSRTLPRAARRSVAQRLRQHYSPVSRSIDPRSRST